MGTTPVCQITAGGCIRPTFPDCLTYIQTAYRAIYGQDIYLGADSQDGQFMALLANAIHDANGQTLAVYNAYSPASAVGAGLSALVKLNGIRRKSATYSTCDFICVGQVNISITNGALRDPAGNTWVLPAFTIPAAGQVLVTGICQTLGAVALDVNGIDTANNVGSIATPQLGWQAAYNPSPAAVGQPVESDSQLRQRQALSVALPSQSLFEGLVGGVAAVTGVTRLRGYENNSGSPDSNGIPGHSVCLVVEGGDATAIATMINIKRGNAGTWGNTGVSIVDAAGVTRTVTFSRPIYVPVYYTLQVRSLGGYTVGVDAQLKSTLAAWTNSLGIGVNVHRDAAYAPAKLNGDPLGEGYEIVSLRLGRVGGSAASADAAIAYSEVATCDPANIAVTIVP